MNSEKEHRAAVVGLRCNVLSDSSEISSAVADEQCSPNSQRIGRVAFKGQFSLIPGDVERTKTWSCRRLGNKYHPYKVN